MLIIVEDVNDNKPIFRLFNTSITLPENIPPGQIETVEAFDEDEGRFGQVLYELQVANCFFCISARFLSSQQFLSSFV